MPAVYVLETQMPQQMIDDVNDYMDEYRQDKNKESLAKTLVGQIDKGEQLLLDHNDKRMVDYNNFICSLGVEYINYFGHSSFNDKILTSSKIKNSILNFMQLKTVLSH